MLLRMVLAGVLVSFFGAGVLPAQQVGNLDAPAAKPKAFVVYAAEHAEIRGVRAAARSRAPSVADGMTGLALSGGGIRSATFCLGVLQALNAAKILQRIDYLSTVSGGGYIGASMTVAMSTSPANKAECFPFGRTCERRTGRLGPNRRNAGKLASPYPQASNLK